MDTEIMKFKSKEDFSSWKHLMEKENKSDYIIVRSHRLKGKLVRYYTCNRSGKKSSASNNVRLPKSQGSCKLNRYCTSGIKVIESKNILVTWCKTHYGHSIDLQHIKIPKIDRSVVASKLTLGVPKSRILDSYRDKIGDNISREDLITRKDIRNIKISYHINISEGVKHENDALSVELWTKQCEEEENNPILLYKKQGVEDNMYGLMVVDFCLVIMTDFQKSMFKKFGDNIIAVDGTHGLNNYNFELTSILVVDEFGEGIPVAFMFTNRKDTYVYQLFFNVIKLSIGIVSPKTMTKLQNSEKNKLTDEVILQIESHLTTIDNLLEMPFTSPDNFIPQISHQEPGNKKIDKQQRFFSTQKKNRGCKNECKKASNAELGEIDKNLRSNFTELYISHSLADDHNYV